MFETIYCITIKKINLWGQKWVMVCNSYDGKEETYFVKCEPDNGNAPTSQIEN